jgi:hypothetical protein
MKLASSFTFRAVFGLTLLASAAFAQKEQWLSYHTSSEGRGYQYIQISTNAPAKVTLPKLEGESWFGCWTTPLDPAGRVFCLDHPSKGGLCDRLFFDLNGNGRLDDETPVKAMRKDEYTAYFDPLRLVFKGEDGPFTYHLLIRFSKYSKDSVNLLASAGGFYSGTVDFAGKKHKIELIDGNVNGIFNDSGKTTSDTDRISILNDKNGERHIGRFVEVDNDLFTLEVARDGAFVKVKKAENVTFGKVRIPAAINSCTVFGANGQFSRKPEKGEATLPAGTYQVQDWTLNRKDSKGSEWQLMGYNFNEKGIFEIVADKPASLDIGEPIRANLHATQMTNEIAFNLEFRGPSGESVQIEKGNQRPAGPKLTLASLDGTYRSTNTFEFG